jgi:hypothetical protein
MGYESTMEFDHPKMAKIRTKKDLYRILSQPERDFLDEDYPDLTIEGGYFGADEYYRKNYNSEKWVSIIRKIAKKEKFIFEIRFIGEDNDSWGYKAYPNGKVNEITQVWEERSEV